MVCKGQGHGAWRGGWSCSLLHLSAIVLSGQPQAVLGEWPWAWPTEIIVYKNRLRTLGSRCF